MNSLIGITTEPLIARVYLKLGTWQWALSPGLDDESIQGSLACVLYFFISNLILSQLFLLSLFPNVLRYTQRI